MTYPYNRFSVFDMVPPASQQGLGGHKIDRPKQCAVFFAKKSFLLGAVLPEEANSSLNLCLGGSSGDTGLSNMYQKVCFLDTISRLLYFLGIIHYSVLCSS